MANLPQYLVNTISDDLLSLSTKEQIDKIHKLAQLLPDFNKLAFEFDLQKDKGLDFHLNIKVKDNVNRILHQLKVSTLKEKEKWQPILSLMERWMQSQHILNIYLLEMFLEFDNSVTSNELQLPSVFFKVNSKKNKKDALELTKEIITSLKGNAFFETNQTLIESCIFNTEDNTYVGYLGLMLSRPLEVVRLNICQLNTKNVFPFLEKWGWEGNKTLLEKYFTTLTNITDEVVLSVDVYKNKILPRIGLEAFINHMPYKDPRWNHALSWYESEGLCTNDKKNIVLNWNRTIFPFDDPNWHESLVLNSSEKKAEEFSILKQLTFHSKVTIEQEKLKAKAYLGFGQTWISKEVPELSFIENNTCAKAIETGISFLLDKQQQSGYWRDYLLPPGTSDQWVSAYIANILLGLNNSKADLAANKAWTILKSTYRENKGWGYSFLTPTDADSTAWSLLLAEQIKDIDFFDQHKNILLQYLSKNNGVTTYHEAESIRKNAQLETNASVEGWTAEHICVSAVVGKIFPDQVLPFLCANQNEKGYWESYWWTSPIYATYMAILAFKKANIAIPRELELRNFLQQEKENNLNSIAQNKLCNTFYLSLLICICIEMGETNNLEVLVQNILLQQQSTGYWQGCSELRVPQPGIIEPKAAKDFFVVNDQNHLFTTATVLHMLNQYNKK